MWLKQQVAMSLVFVPPYPSPQLVQVRKSIAVGVVMLLTLVGIGFTGIWWKMTKGNPGLLEQVIWAVVALGLASVLPLLGLFLLRKAKRRWMEVELG